MSEYRHAHRHARFRRARGLLAALAVCTATLTTGAPAAHAAEPGEPSDTAVRLPSSTYSRMLVDQGRQRVYVTTGALNATVHELLVYDFDGNLLRTVKTDALIDPGAMMLSADGSILYVGVGSYILMFNPDTFSYIGGGWVRSDFFKGRCAGDIVVTTGGTLRFTRMTRQSAPTDCTTEPQALYSVLPGGDQPESISSEVDPKIAVSPAGDKIVEAYAYGSKLAVGVWNATGSNLTRSALRGFVGPNDPTTVPRDVAVSPDGELALVAAGVSGTKTLSITDLSEVAPGYGPLPDGTSSTAVAFSPDGSLLARGGAVDGTAADLLVQSADPARGDAPREYAFTDGTNGGDRVADRGLAFSADGSRLFAMTTDAAGDAYWLHVISNPDARYHSSFDSPLTAQPGTPYAGQAVRISGRLQLNGPAPSRPVQVTALRHDSDGDHAVPSATVGSDGTFTLDDTPAVTGQATYTVSFAGDSAHDPAQDATLAVDVVKAPTDLTLDPPTRATTSGVEIHGTLTTPGAALSAGTTVDVRRVTKKGVIDLPAVAVGPDGSFTVDDVPPAKGSTLYVVSYDGDALHEASADYVTVDVTP
ncbi:WD40 repeat domain-containing protein [Streptomyces sp. NPDC007264]|uniref:WD40 repeat domain-containing protein n=1 Tax=Streptomyces sp. NPDC007264 TaxID=3364777 RepID=UPI0036DE6490